MKKWATIRIVVLTVSTALISGCAVTERDTQVRLDTVASEEEEASQGAKAIFTAGEGPATATIQQSFEPLISSTSQPPSTTQPWKPKAISKESYMGLSYWAELIGKDGQRQYSGPQFPDDHLRWEPVRNRGLL